ncbi:MAG: hypothetical protein NZ534_05065 [Bacteroidia bacterium]|nr:hypothetical protein [Bacteroidia bacterium]
MALFPTVAWGQYAHWAEKTIAENDGYIYRGKDFSIRISEFRRALPGAAVCGQTLKAHNNVDLIRYNGRYYMAYRTAAFHFPSHLARINVLSSDDGKNWQCEFGFRTGKDLREPRFLEINGRLFLYFFEGSESMWKFRPGKIYATELDKHWTDPRPLEPELFDGYVPWRFRVKDGTAYMSAYKGGDVYKIKGGGQKCHVRLFQSQDGVRWRACSDTPEFDRRWAEEGEIIFDREGNLWGTVRLEAKGGALVWTENGNTSLWKSKFLPRKYDSALLFDHGEHILLIARRHLAQDGVFMKRARLVPRKMRNWFSLICYSFSRKRTAIYKIDKQNKDVVFLCDLPSRGDTAFAGVAPISAGRYLVANYSNDVDGADWPWIVGQLKPTQIYTFELTIE